MIVSYCPAQILPLFVGRGGEVGGDIRSVGAESLLGGGVECCLLQVGGSSIKVAEGHLGYRGPDHQALS